MKKQLTYIQIILTFMTYLIAQNHPNIVFILCDDLGYGDVHYLNPERGKIPTPCLDSLGQQSMVFTDAHANSSVCTPSRYGILTGRYSWRSTLQKSVIGENKDCIITEGRLTLPKMLQQYDYHTACIGKWHLGYEYKDLSGNNVLAKASKQNPQNLWRANVPVGTKIKGGPVDHGFDYHYGFQRSATMSTVVHNDEVIDDAMPTDQTLQMLQNKSCEYIQERAQNKEQPFFLYLALNSPHTPLTPSAEWIGKSNINIYADFVMETDDVIGKVVQQLDDSGFSENTLVVFTSDNGCSAGPAKCDELEENFGHYSSAQFRGYKSDIWEGGHRVPFFVRWPKVIEQGIENKHLICLNDFMATCADIVGYKTQEDEAVDSNSFLTTLKNPNNAPNKEAVIHHSISGKFSIRKGKWKLECCPGSGGWSKIKDKDARKSGLPEEQLYDLSKDIQEKDNKIETFPEVAQELRNLLIKYVEQGRSTAGSKQENETEIDIFKRDS